MSDSKIAARLLDDVDDARTKLDRYRHGLFWTVVALLCSVGAVLVGAWFGSYAIGAALCVMGGFGIPLSLVFGGIWIFCGNCDDHPADELRRAERAYREHLSASVTDF